MHNSPVTIINDRKLRGVLVPKSLLTERVLEDVVDLIELSLPKALKKAENRIKEAEHKKSWIPLEKVIAKARKAA